MKVVAWLKQNRQWVILALLVIGGWWWLKTRQPAEEAALSAPETVTVARETVRATVVATGTIEPETSVEVKANAGGEITSLLVDVGDVVKAGDLLATIDPTDSQTAVSTARANLTSARSSVTQSQATEALDRVSQPARVTDATEAVRAARARLRSAEQSLEMAEVAARTNTQTAQAALTIAAERADRADTTRTMGTASAEANLAQARESRDQAASRLAQAQATLSLAEDQTAADLAQAQQNLTAAKARLERAELTARTTPITAQAQVREAEASLTTARQNLAKLNQATHPAATATTRGDYASAEVALAAANAELERQQQLLAKGYVARAAVETAATAAAAAQALAHGKAVRMALNQDMCSADAPLKAGDEVAFFPPVTGG